MLERKESEVLDGKEDEECSDDDSCCLFRLFLKTRILSSNSEMMHRSLGKRHSCMLSLSAVINALLSTAVLFIIHACRQINALMNKGSWSKSLKFSSQ